MDEDAIAAILGPPNERLIALLHLCGDNAALIQAVTAWGALVRADEREKAAQVAEAPFGPGLAERDDYWQPRIAAAIRAQA